MPPKPTSDLPTSFLRSTEQWSPATSKGASRSRRTSQGPPLFVIAEFALTDINARIGAKDIGEVKIGDKATFTAEAFSNHPFSGMVTQIRLSPEDHEQTYDVIIRAPNPDLLLKAGMAGRIRIMIGRQVDEE